MLKLIINSVIVFLLTVLLVVNLLAAPVMAGQDGQEAKPNNLMEFKLSDLSALTDKDIDFVIFGLSDNNSGDDGRSDTIIICHADYETRELDLISILRDTKAQIPGHDPQKINAAYKYGGAQLALETINLNFGTDLSDYITINLDILTQIIDVLGGVEIYLSQMEADFINYYTGAVWTDPESGYADDSQESYVFEGDNFLSGTQATLYSRIRSDSDRYRVQRQQYVIQSMFQGIKGASISQLLKIAGICITELETSLTAMEILSLLLHKVTSYEIKTYSVPDAEYETDVRGVTADEHGEWVWMYDLDNAGERIREIIE